MNQNLSKVRSGRQAKKFSQVSPKLKIFIVIGVVALVLTGCGIGFAVYGYITAQAQAPGVTYTEATFIVSSWPDGEVVSANIPLEIYLPDADEFTETGYIYDELTEFSNWKKEKSGDADDIKLDLSSVSYVLIRVDPNNETVFQPYDLILPAANGPYLVEAYHMSSDVNHILINDAMASITLVNFSTAGNYTHLFNFPSYNPIDAHYGPKWEMSAADFAKLSQSKQEEYWDEAEWRSQPFVYNIEKDQDHDYEDPLERGTNAFAFEYIFNNTPNATDGSAYQVNMTITGDDAYAFEKVISGTSIFLIATQSFSVINGPGEYNAELSFGSAIGLDDIKSVRVDIPKDEDSVTVSKIFSSMEV